MGGEALDLSVIIVNSSHRELLRQCLAAVFRAQLPPRTEVIVVDNASDDGSVEMVRAEFPQAKLLPQTVRRGPAGNYNRGFEVARGRYVLVLNEDAEPQEDALIRLYDFMEAHPKVGICGPRLTYPDGRPQRSCNRFPDFSVVWKRLVLGNVISGPWVDHMYGEEDLGQPFEPDWIMATSLMIRRSAMDEVGPYDEQFVIYYEETDLARRLRNRGYTVAWVPQALVKHHHGVSNFKLRGERDIHFRMLLYQSRYRYFRKHFGPLFTGTVRAIEAALFGVFAAKTSLESLIPSRREEAALKTRLYTSLLRYALLCRGQYDVPQPG